MVTCVGLIDPRFDESRGRDKVYYGSLPIMLWKDEPGYDYTIHARLESGVCW